MRIGYLECFSGISGDMLLGALLDAGVSAELLEKTAQGLEIGASLRIARVDRSGIRSTKVDVLESGQAAERAPEAAAHTHDHSHEHSHTHRHSHAHAETHSHSHSPDKRHDHQHAHGRSWAQIRALIGQATLPEDARALALRAFALLAEAEAKIHNMPVESVHFHEVGAVDTIVDIVCNSVGLCSLGVDQWRCSPLNVGGGTVDCAHGRFPVPAPATAELLKGVPTYSSGIEMELVTPTGAALLSALGCGFGSAPAMRTHAIGYGAGGKDPKRFANVVRLSIGDSLESGSTAPGTEAFASETITVLECAVDDLSPQIVAHTLELVLERGALDAMSSPVGMKKGRLGTLITVLCRNEQAGEMQALLFRETSTLGIRVREEKRVYLERKHIEVETRYGPIRMKVGSARGEEWNTMPEYEDCRRAAEEHGVALKQVMQAAMAAFTEAKVRG